MTNYEKYKDWFDKNELAFKYCGVDFGVIKGSDRPEFCHILQCSGCIFCDCEGSERIDWMNSEAVEKPESNTDCVDWSKVEVDTKIQVKSDEEDEWENKHFAKYENDTVYAFLGGLTSFTAPRLSRYTAWPIVRLYKED